MSTKDQNNSKKGQEEKTAALTSENSAEQNGQSSANSEMATPTSVAEKSETAASESTEEKAETTASVDTAEKAEGTTSDSTSEKSETSEKQDSSINGSSDSSSKNKIDNNNVSELPAKQGKADAENEGKPTVQGSIPQTPPTEPVKINDELVGDDSEEENEEVDQLIKEKVDIEHKIADLIATGRMFKAHTIAKRAYQKHPENIDIAQAYSLVLLKTGAFEESRKLLYPILGVFPKKDEETGEENISLEDVKRSQFLLTGSAEMMANVGHIFRESWKYSRQCRDLEISRELYYQSFQKNQNTTTGINAAWNAWLTGEDELAKKLAASVLRLLPPYGLEASFRELIDLAEAQLLLGREDDACKLYEEAMKQHDAQEDSNEYISVVTARQQLYFLREAGFKIPNSALDVLTPPTIVVFTGHAIDHPSFQVSLFPPELENDIKRIITEKLQSIDAKIGYSSASCGADLLFIEALQELGGEVNIILPFAISDFVETNVRHAGPRWEKRFEKAIANAHSVSFACEDRYLGHDMLYRFSNHVMHGSAVMRGKFLTTEPHLMAVWHSRTDSMPGGPADFIDRWTNISTLHLIDLDELGDPGSAEKATDKIDSELVKQQKLSLNFDPFIDKSPDRVIRSMMFSDLSGYSKLRDEHIPSFLDFLEKLNKAMEKIGISLESINTWGDAVFAVADSAIKIANFGLQYCDLIEELGRKYPEFPFPIRARISLHSGPVFIATDPFIKKMNFYGGHINRAARLEPVTAVGQVYATQQFVSMLHGETNDERNEFIQRNLKYYERYSTEYVGTIALAKSFGQQEVYHLRWRN